MFFAFKKSLLLTLAAFLIAVTNSQLEAQQSYKPLVERGHVAPGGTLSKWLSGTFEGKITHVLIAFPAIEELNVCQIWKSDNIEKLGSLRLEIHRLEIGQKRITVELSGRQSSKILFNSPSSKGIYTISFGEPELIFYADKPTYVAHPTKACAHSIGKKASCRDNPRHLIPSIYFVGLTNPSAFEQELICIGLLKRQ